MLCMQPAQLSMMEIAPHFVFLCMRKTAKANKHYSMFSSSNFCIKPSLGIKFYIVMLIFIVGYTYLLVTLLSQACPPHFQPIVWKYCSEEEAWLAKQIWLDFRYRNRVKDYLFEGDVSLPIVVSYIFCAIGNHELLTLERIKWNEVSLQERNNHFCDVYCSQREFIYNNKVISWEILASASVCQWLSCQYSLPVGSVILPPSPVPRQGWRIQFSLSCA